MLLHACSVLTALVDWAYNHEQMQPLLNKTLTLFYITDR